MKPILDSSKKTDLFADNVAIDDGKGQPTTFKVNFPFELEDADGTVVYATVEHITGDISSAHCTRKPEAWAFPFTARLAMPCVSVSVWLYGMSSRKARAAVVQLSLFSAKA